MDKLKQQIAIAEYCKWQLTKLNVGWSLKSPSGREWQGDGVAYKHEMPNYCNSLDAMHEAELNLWGDYDKYDYLNRLIKILEQDHKDFEMNWEDHQGISESLFTTFASASQRAEAYLRTIGKWEE